MRQSGILSKFFWLDYYKFLSCSGTNQLT